MAVYNDDFTRPDSTSLGSMPGGGPAYEVVSGNWQLLNNKPTTSDLSSTSPIVAVSAGTGDADLKVTIATGGGDSIYGRVSGAPNYIRGRLRTYASTTTQTVTEYEWVKTIPGSSGYTVYVWNCVTRTGSPAITYELYRKWYGHEDAPNPHGSPAVPPTATPDIAVDIEVQQGQTPVFPDPRIYPTHTHIGYVPHSHGIPGFFERDTGTPGYSLVRTRTEGGYSFTTTVVETTTPSSPTGYYSTTLVSTYVTGATEPTLSAPIWTRDATNPPESGYYRTGATRTVDVPSGVIKYDIILEKRVNDVLSQLAIRTVDNPPTQLQLRLVGPAITLTAQGSSLAAVSLTANDSHNSTVGRHGFGRGPSDQAAIGLDNFTINTLNSLPGAPALVSPIGGAVINRNAALRLVHNFNDADSGDSRSKSEQQWRVQGTTAWNVDTKLGPDNYHEYPANTFPAGTIEWQARDADSTGTYGAYSSIATFVAATVPAGPQITQPVSGQTINTATSVVKWLTSTQAAFQVLVQRTGNPSFDSGVIQSATTREFTISHPYNASNETVVVRTFSAQGLASADSTVPITVAFNPPLVPYVAFTPNVSRGSILVQVVNQTGGPTNAMANTVYVRERDNPSSQFTGIRGIAKNATWEYMTPASDVEYEFMVETRGENGTTSRTPWLISSTTAPTTPGGGTGGGTPTGRSYGSGTYGSGAYGLPVSAP